MAALARKQSDGIHGEGRKPLPVLGRALSFAPPAEPGTARFRYRIAGKENVFAIGEYPGIGLAEARAEHGKARALVKQGVHHSHNRQAERLSSQVANANTFEAVAREWISKKSPTWTGYYLRQVTRFFESDVFPHTVFNATYRPTGSGSPLSPA